MLQVEIIIGVSLLILCLVWKDLLAVFFDESHAVSIGLSPLKLKILFFTPAQRLYRRRAANRRRHFGDRHGDHAGRHRLPADRSLPAGW